MYPRSPTDLTASNLGPALSLDPSSIASVETEVIGQGVGFLCQLARVKFSYRENARGPKSLVAKYPAAIEQTRGLARQFKFYEKSISTISLPKMFPCQVRDACMRLTTC